jgi:hypothetical protein
LLVIFESYGAESFRIICNEFFAIILHFADKITSSFAHALLLVFFVLLDEPSIPVA